MTESPGDAKNRYSEKLGVEFGEYFFHLNQNVFGLIGIWDVYRSFFGTDEQRVDLLNRASGYVALTVQDALHERIILGVCQVTDPAESGGRKNLTIRGLPRFISDQSCRDEVAAMIDIALDRTSFARDLRNKLLAHSDLAATVGSYQVDYSSREKITSAIRSIITPLRRIHMRYLDATQLFHSIRPHPDETGFLRCVYLGVRHLEEEARSWTMGGREKQDFPDWLSESEQNEFDSEFYLPKQA